MRAFLLVLLLSAMLSACAGKDQSASISKLDVPSECKEALAINNSDLIRRDCHNAAEAGSKDAKYALAISYLLPVKNKEFQHNSMDWSEADGLLRELYSSGNEAAILFVAAIDAAFPDYNSNKRYNKARSIPAKILLSYDKIKKLPKAEYEATLHGAFLFCIISGQLVTPSCAELVKMHVSTQNQDFEGGVHQFSESIAASQVLGQMPIEEMALPLAAEINKHAQADKHLIVIAMGHVILSHRDFNTLSAPKKAVIYSQLADAFYGVKYDTAAAYCYRAVVDLKQTDKPALRDYYNSAIDRLNNIAKRNGIADKDVRKVRRVPGKEINI